MRIISLLVVVFLGSYAYAASELSPSGHMRARYVYDVKPDSDSVTSHQAVFGLTFRSGERFSSHLEMLHSGNWGEGDNTNTPVSKQKHPNSALQMYQAYANWMAYDDVLFQVGRQAVDFGGGMVFSDNIFKNDPYSFDSLKVTYDSDVAVVDLWGIKYADVAAGVGTGVDPERNIYVLNVNFKSLPTLLSKTEVHLIQDSAQKLTASSTPSKNVLRYGLHIGGSWNSFFYQGVYAAESGEEGGEDVSTSMLDSNFGLNFVQFHNLNLILGYHIDSGDSDGDATSGPRNRYDSYFYDSHKYAGLMDVLNWGNLTYYYVQVEAEASDTTKYGIGYYGFSKSEVLDKNYVRGVADVDTGTESELGVETDLYIDHTVTEAFSLSGHFGYFTTSNTNISEDPMWQVLMQADWKF